MKLKKNLNKVCSVAKSSNRKLNIDKSVVMRFRSHAINDNINFNYNIGGRILEFVSSHKNLYVLVDSRLQFHEPVLSVVWKPGGLAEKLYSTVCCNPSFIVGLYLDQLWIFDQVLGI